MLISDLDLEERIKSPDNLINSLRARLEGESKAVSVRIPEVLPFKPTHATTARNISAPAVFDTSMGLDNSFPALDDLVSNPADKIKMGLAKTSAAEVLVDTLNHLKSKIEDEQSPLSLSRIATDMSKVISSIEASGKGKTDINIGQQIIVYRPAIATENNYESVYVND